MNTQFLAVCPYTEEINYSSTHTKGHFAKTVYMSRFLESVLVQHFLFLFFAVEKRIKEFFMFHF